MVSTEPSRGATPIVTNQNSPLTNTFLWICRLSRRRRQWHPTPGFLPGKSHGWRSLVGCCPWGREESGMTERLHFHFSLSCIGEGNGNPLQCFCLENPRDGGAWWLPSLGSHRVGHDLSDLAAAAGYKGLKRPQVLYWVMRYKGPMQCWSTHVYIALITHTDLMGFLLSDL